MKSLITSLAMACAACAAAQDALPEPLARPVDFAREVHTILAEKCYTCHAGNKERGGLKVSSREAILEGGETGPAALPGDSANSLIIKLVAGLGDAGLRMPPKGDPLSTEEIAVLRAWIDQGLEWNLEIDPNANTYATPLALQSVAVPSEPAGAHPLDRLLAPYFAENGFTPGETVPDALFARRVFLDIIGMPPTPEQLAEFTASAEPDKRGALIQKLLGDRQGYAEHWMTFWNDALRNDYKGTGYIDGGRTQITEWLYEALYENLPYDQFVTQLIAPTPASAGFINGIKWRGDANSSQLTHMQAAQNVSQLFMGVNLKCASCHDSFVNQWTLADAYGMASVFTDDPLEMVRCDNPTGEIAEVQFIYPELGAIDAERDRKGRMNQLARLVTDEDNGRFARTYVNRIWAVLMGHGFIEPLDDLDAAPWHADALEWLAADFVAGGYDTKRLLETIVTSRAYQLPVDGAYNPEEPFVFRGPLARRIAAEQFLDSLSLTAGVWQAEASFSPPHPSEAYAAYVRAWRVPADTLTKALGRPTRDVVTLRREDKPTTIQALELNNGGMLDAFLAQSGEKLIAAANGDRDAVVRAVYQGLLLREPGEAEWAVSRETLGETPSPATAADLLWMVAMLPEFQYIH